MKNKISKTQIDLIKRKVYREEDDIEKYLNRKIAMIEEEIGMHVNISITDDRSYACGDYTYRIHLAIDFKEPNEGTRQYLPKKRNGVK